MRLPAQILFSLVLAVFFLKELLVSSIRVAGAVLAPSKPVAPVFLRMPLDAKSDVEIMLTANLISLTPGTLSVDIAKGKGELLIHSMFAADDPQAEIHALKSGIERRVLQATQGRRVPDA